jgi:hypothetical protein
MPGIGNLNLPNSLLAWDVVVLNGYLVLNFTIVTYLLFSLYRGKSTQQEDLPAARPAFDPAAIGIHTVTAFLYNGLPRARSGTRLDPGAALHRLGVLLGPGGAARADAAAAALHALRDHRRSAIWKIAELMAYAMGGQPVPARRRGVQGVLFEHRAPDPHAVHVRGLGEHKAARALPVARSVFASIAAFLLFLIPRRASNPVTLVNRLRADLRSACTSRRAWAS